MAKKEIEKINTERRVVQKNPLLELSYPMSVTSQKIMRLIIAHIDDKRDEIMYQYEFKTSDFVEALGLENDPAAPERIRKALRQLRGEVLEIPREYFNGEKTVITGWLAEAELYKYKNKITATISGNLKPFLYDIKEKFFTKYKVCEVLGFSGEYTLRLFEWLLAEKFKASSKSGAWYTQFELREIRRRFAHLNDKGKVVKYPRWPDFRRRVIEAAIDEISEKTEYLAGYETIKSGRRVTGIIFHMTPKTAPKPKTASPPTEMQKAVQEKKDLEHLKLLLEKCSDELKNRIKETQGEEYNRRIKINDERPPHRKLQASTIEMLSIDYAIEHHAEEIRAGK